MLAGILAVFLAASATHGLSTPAHEIRCDGTVPDELWSPLVAQKVYKTAANVSSTSYPQLTDRVQGKWINYGVDYWTSGFLPAELYAMRRREELCPSLKSSYDWLELGREWSRGLLSLIPKNSVGHDVGFISFPFLEELTINPANQTAKNAILGFADVLAKRYNSVVGCTRSWDASDPTDFQVIIDNMINLELFFVAEQLTGNSTFRKMAITHADQTILNHIRPDGGTYHVVEYNSTTGRIIKRRTAQGYSDSSTWSRGQAWAIFGFANMYARTHNISYLDTSKKLASYFLSHMPSDGIVPWDFQAPTSPVRPSDTSAAMLAVNGMLYISRQETTRKNATGARYWNDAAIKVLHDNVKFAWKPTWDSLLANGTVNNPVGSNMTGIIYGDYYMIEAGNRLIEMGLTQCPHA